jgi:4-amino-4-deoxy-L-arabinose transferase-like glycosyltransferase
MAVLTRLRGFGGALAAIAGAAFILRLAYMLGVDPQVPALSDAGAYHLLANHLADGHGYVRPFDLSRLGLVHPTAEYPPLFPAILSAVPFVGGTGVDAQRILTCMIGTGTVAMVGLLGRRVRGDAVGLVAAGLAAIYPMLFMADGVLMAESLFAFLVTTSLVLAYRAVDAPSLGRFAALGAMLGLAALTRAEGLLLAIVLVVPLAWRLGDTATVRKVALAAVAVGVAVAFVIPWTVRNAVELDHFVPVSNNVGSAIDGANCAAVYYGDDIGLWRANIFTAATDDPNARDRECFDGFDIRAAGFNEAEEAARHREDGLDFARDNLGRLPVVAAARWARTFGIFHVEQQLEVESFEGRPEPWQTIGLISYWVLLPFGIAGAVLLLRNRERAWPLLAPFVSVSIIAVLTYGNQRFRIAAEPALLVLASVAVVALVQHLRRPAPQPEAVAP